ncbi:unnamed protein product [Mytilus coruscus]|uniref:B box-type domain-containing protein n=1 Tax=Mytilus coruscus TaxID=42192 RepID=A0A6J8D4L1_MYTCO|nr:unnamed protein product [Mytilus coruscus]
MATTSNVFCEICEALSIMKAAKFWCSECDEGLCLQCHKHHSISKSSRQHNAIQIESYNKLPTSIANIVNYCASHDMKYTNYCPHHDTLCCPACISDEHKRCTGLLLLQDVIRTAKTSALLDSLETSVKDIQTNIKNIIEDRQRNLAIIHDQRQRYQDDLKQIRIEINSHLDKLEQNIVRDLDATEKKAKTEIAQLVDTLVEKTKVVDDMEKNIFAIKMYASDLQAYIGSKSIDTEVEKEENYIQSLNKDGSLHQIRIQFKIDNKLSNIDSIINSFGKVTTSTELPLLALKRWKDTQAQIMLPVPQIVQKPFDEITLSKISKFTIQERGRSIYVSELKGMSVLPNGKIILADSGNWRLLLANYSDGMMEKEISISSAEKEAFDVTFIKDNLVALSTSYGILIINIRSGTIVKKIQTNGKCQGIAYNNGTLICCIKSIGIQCIKLLNKTVTTLVKIDKRSDRLGLAVHGNKIYETDFSNNIVSCYTLEGHKLWQFKNTSVMLGPTGIAVDSNSNVYVASYSYNCVIVLSSDGQKFKKILSSKDGLLFPRAICFDEMKNNLLVANIEQPVFLYNISFHDS